MQKLSFTSADMPETLPRDQVARGWCEALTASKIKHEVDCPNPDGFFAACETMTFGATTLTRATATSIVVNRHRRHISRDGHNSVLLLLNDGTGALGGAQLRREIALAPGTATLFDVGEPYSSHARAGSSALGLYVERSALDGTGIELADRLARPLDPTRPAVRMLMHYLRLQLALDTGFDPALDALTESHVGDLLVLALGGTKETLEQARSRGLSAARLAALRDQIRRRATEPSISADSLGQALGMSGRSVQHLMQQHGTTLSDEISARRSETAFDLLRDARANGRKVVEIAFEAGFDDLSTFYRAFKRRYGISPGDARDAGDD